MILWFNPFVASRVELLKRQSKPGRFVSFTVQRSTFTVHRLALNWFKMETVFSLGSFPDKRREIKKLAGMPAYRESRGVYYFGDCEAAAFAAGSNGFPASRNPATWRCGVPRPLQGRTRYNRFPRVNPGLWFRGPLGRVSLSAQGPGIRVNPAGCSGSRGKNYSDRISA